MPNNKILHPSLVVAVSLSLIGVFSAACASPPAPQGDARAENIHASPGGQLSSEAGTAALIHLTPDVPWIVSPDEPEPVRRAIDDLQRDWYKVMGLRPVVLAEAPASYNGPILYLGNKAAERYNLVAKKFSGPESFSLRAMKDSQNRPALVGAGADMRGSIYALYALSEEVLGVDPWYFWVDKEPAFKGSIDIPAGFDRSSGPPTFKYRGWFINDEDLLHTFSPDPMRENVFSLAMYDRIYETLLRLRGNMIVPATFPFPDERCQALAVRRGLVLNMHHILVLGLNTYQWPPSVPFSYKTHPEIMEKYWQSCIDAFKDYEVVWTVGFRGKHDRPFWVDEPSIQTPAERGAIISQAIAKEVEMIRKTHPNAAIISNLWMEGAELAAAGHLKIPAGVTAVWPDDGAGLIRDNGRVTKGQGVYYHTAMLSGNANQLSEMVPPGRIFEQVGRFVRAGATEFLLVNVSDIRPVPLSTDCIMRMAWNAKPYLDKSDAQNMDAFLLDWSTRQFGADAAPAVASVYRDYFAIPYMQRDQRLGDNTFYTRLKQLAGGAMPLLAKDKPLPRPILDELQSKGLALTEKALPHLRDLAAKAQSVAARIPPERKNFYQAHVLTQIGLHLNSALMLDAWCRALLAYSEKDAARMIELMQKSLAAVDAAIASLHAAEYGQWSAFYRGEGFVGLANARDKIRASLASLRHEPPPPARGGMSYRELEAYQRPFADNFPLLYPPRMPSK